MKKEENTPVNDNAEPMPEACAIENDEIMRLREQVDDWQDKYLRVLAEAENEKRRYGLDALSAIDSRVSKFALDMIPLADNLRIAIDSLDASPAVAEGFSAILKAFEAALEAQGIMRIKTLGEPLNPAQHLVVSQVESTSEFPSGTVALEMQAGYTLGDRVIREAMVAVAK